MANQYKSALHYVKEKLQGDLDKYGIEVNADKRIMVVDNFVTQIPPYTEYKDCEKIIKDKIKEIKAAEKAELQKNQTSLLPGENS